ncbi:MAG: polysaccharide export protein [Ramlibacter sp.]|nr:polysaccharide export protein [Ramlibacter sp.]
MFPAVYRCALVVATLLVATTCLAQGSAQSAATASAAQDSQGGVFRPIPAELNGASNRGNGQQQTPVMGLGKEYRVGPNDLLDIEVLNLDGGKRTVRVNSAGSVTLPLIGVIVVAGLTQEQVETHVASLYGEKYLQNPQVSVFIREFTTERITVDGAISKPGIYPLVGQMTLLRVIALAGGFGSIANRTEVKLFRNGDKGDRVVATFDVERIRSGQDPDPAIRGDDLIVVQRDPTRALLNDSLFRDIVNTVNPLSYIPK